VKMAALYVVALYDLVEAYQSFRGTSCKFCTFVPSGGILRETPWSPSGFGKFVVICGTPGKL
jgi:hypothetical protein